MMYLGVPGRMVGIKCPTAQRVAMGERYSFSATLGGRVKAQAGPVGRRTWDIQLGSLTTPSEVATLMDFAAGVWGDGPFWFYPADAPVVNMLTPNAASCHPDAVRALPGATILGTPPLDLQDDGHAARSLWKSSAGNAAFGDPIPTIPGQSVTGSAWVIGSGTVRVVFFDATGTEVGAASSVRGSATVQRLSVTMTVPGNAATVELRVTGGVTFAARPALTWTNQVYEWGDGQGCQKAILHNMGRDVVKAWANPHTGRWSDLSFVVQEIG